ncbi:cyclic nucleotide-binding domain-containing protein [Pseudomonas syringae]|nr:cyclic nucleotide-binding domain-containing protein [Pseudomonas syringae]MCF5069637.1 cyclic nucleotide-binding domain-containing protein [Pseudomonas syringae]
MYLLGEQPAHAETLINHLQCLPAQWLEGFAPCGPALALSETHDLQAQLPDDQVFLLSEGLIHGWMGGRALFYWHQGDLIGLQQGQAWTECRLSSEGPVRLTPYKRTELFQYIYQDPLRAESFVRYLTGQQALLAHAIAELKPREFRSTNGFKRVEAGDVLIQQGDTADHVFVIIEGHAEAFVDGRKVGDVPKDEIFGAMAVFTGEPHNATVIAREAITIMLIPGDQFLSLTRTHPKIAHSLIEGMARRIGQLNKQLTQR